MRTLAITGASGQFGQAVLGHLVSRQSADVQIRACTRNLAHFDTLNIAVNDVKALDFAVPESFNDAFYQVHTLLLISIEGEDDERIRLHKAAIHAAVKAGVRRIIYTSFFDVAPQSPSIVARVHRLTEECIIQSGCAYTFLRNGPYVDNITKVIATAARANGLRKGVFRMASDDARMPFIARDDLALAAAYALLSTSEDNFIYKLSGAELLSYQSLCQIVGTAVTLPVRHETMTDDDYRQELHGQGLSVALTDRRIAYVQAMRQGFMTDLTDDYQRLVGHPPRSMSDVVPKLIFNQGD